jgi:hypothetical protein
MRLPALYHGRCKGLSIAEGPLCSKGPGRVDPSILALGERRSSNLHYLTNERRSPHPPAPLRRSPSPARFLRGFCFSQPGEVFFGTSTFHIDFTKAGGPLPKASVGPALETCVRVGAKCPDPSELRSRSLQRSGSFSSTAQARAASGR